MISKFMSLEPEKRDRIINAALEEFSKKKYSSASTNEIVKNADISKGLLFHYFSSKKSLFMFLFDYSVEVFENELFSKLDLEEPDIIKRMKQIEILKYELIHKYPSMYDFLTTIARDDTMEFRQELDDKINNLVQHSYKSVFQNIDISVFKEGCDGKSILNIIIWVIQGFSSRAMEMAKNSDLFKNDSEIKALYAEFDSYIELLKKAFYK